MVTRMPLGMLTSSNIAINDSTHFTSTFVE
nr:MAG TPA: hypothetical protein [Caudoviricetes sp.]